MTGLLVVHVLEPAINLCLYEMFIKDLFECAIRIGMNNLSLQFQKNGKISNVYVFRNFYLSRNH